MPPRVKTGPRAQSFQPPQGELALLAGSANPQRAARIAEHLGVALTPSEAHYFSEGNVFVRVLENVRGKDCFVLQGIHQPVKDSLLALLFWIDELKRARCLMMDLHSPQIQGFFHIPVDHLYARYVICNHIRTLGLTDLVVCAPDVGFAKGASGYASLLGAPVVIGNKTRADHDERAKILELIGDVAGKNVLIVDDFTISGGTLIAMADLLSQRGARDIYAAVSHGVLSKGVPARIAASRIKKLFITDSIECHSDPLTDSVEIVSVARLFAEAIQSIHDRTSISQLFPEPKTPGAPV